MINNFLTYVNDIRITFTGGWAIGAICFITSGILSGIYFIVKWLVK